MAQIIISYIVLAAICFDLLLGDPEFLLHPVQIIGFYIQKTSDFLLYCFKNNDRYLLFSGLFISLTTILISLLIGKYIELQFFQSDKNILFGSLIFFGLSSCLASKSLISSVKEIVNLIEKNNLDNKTDKLIKQKVQKIVSRDVSSSSKEHLLRASFESLTENAVDGIFGPMFWMFLGIFLIRHSIYLPGPLALGFSYKAISTLDSMIGYKKDELKYLGFFSAKIEDFITFIPCRVVLFTLPLVSKKFYKYNYLIHKSITDGKQYSSPNAGISEAIFAHIVNIRLGGESIYDGKTITKPTINPQGRLCRCNDINVICEMIYRLIFLWSIIYYLLFLMTFI